MPSTKTLMFALITLAIALLVGVGALWFAGERQQQGFGEALVGGPFELTNQDGKRMTEKDFLGRHMLIFFGYTYCPDVCPTELQVMSAALDRLGPEAEKIQPIFISIDPERDTPQVVKEYVGNFHPRMVGLTGSPEDIAKVAGAYRVYYGKAKGQEAAADYLMDHSSLLYLMGPDGKYEKFFSYSTDAEALAAGLRDAVNR